MPDTTDGAGDPVKHKVTNNRTGCDLCGAAADVGTTYVEMRSGRIKIGLTCAAAINTARTA